MSIIAEYVNQHDFHLTDEQRDQIELQEVFLTLTNVSIVEIKGMLVIESDDCSCFLQRFSPDTDFILYTRDRKRNLKEIANSDPIKLINLIVKFVTEN